MGCSSGFRDLGLTVSGSGTSGAEFGARGFNASAQFRLWGLEAEGSGLGLDFGLQVNRIQAAYAKLRG